MKHLQRDVDKFQDFEAMRKARAATYERANFHIVPCPCSPSSLVAVFYEGGV